MAGGRAGAPTFAVLAVGRQQEAGGAGAAVGAQRVLARVLAEPRGRRPALVHVCGRQVRGASGGRGAWTPAPTPTPGRGGTQGPQGAIGRREQGRRRRDTRTDRAKGQETRATGSVRGASAGQTPGQGRAGGQSKAGWGRGQAHTGGRPGHQPHLPMQARPKASRWKPGLQSQR